MKKKVVAGLAIGIAISFAVVTSLSAASADEAAALKRTSLLLARAYIETENWSAALTELSRLKKRYPNDRYVLNDLATVYGKLGRVEEAEEIYHRLMELYPENDLYALDLAYLLTENGRYSEVIKLIEKRRKDKKEMDRDTVLLLADAYEKSGNYEKVIELYDSLLTDAPDHVPTLLTVGEYHLAKDKLPLARKYFQRVCELEPQNYRGVKGLALTFSGIDPDKYVEYLLKARPLDKDDHNVAYLLGEHYFWVSQGKSIKYYNEALTRLDRVENPSTDQQRAQARILYRTGKPDEAESLYLSLISSYPQDLDLKNDYAEMLIEQKRYDEATKLFELLTLEDKP